MIVDKLDKHDNTHFHLCFIFFFMDIMKKYIKKGEIEEKNRKIKERKPMISLGAAKAKPKIEVSKTTEKSIKPKKPEKK